MAGLRSIGMQLKGLPNTNFCCFRSALSLTPAPTTWPRHLMPIDQFRNQQIDFCEQLCRQTTRTCYKGSALIEERQTVWSQRQSEGNALASSEKNAKYPNLDVKLPIRQVAPVPKEIRNISYISDEFKELLRKHDEEMLKKYILSFLPEKYTSYKLKLKEQIEAKKPYCICEDSAATAGDKSKTAKKRNFFKMLSCCTKSSGSIECQCSRGKQGECEMCSQRSSTKKSNLKKNVTKSKEKNIRVSKAKSVEIFKDEKDLDKRYWVGNEMQKQEMQKQNKPQLDKKDSKCKLKGLFKKTSTDKVGK